MVVATPLATIALTVLLVNFRHVFYAFSFPLHLVKNRWAKAYSVYAMIDEAYAVNASLPEAERSAPRLLAMQLSCQTYWVGGGLVGGQAEVLDEVGVTLGGPLRLDRRPRRLGRDHRPGPPVGLDQPGLLQHLDVLGDRGKRQLERLRELVDAGFALRKAGQDRPPCRVGQSGEGLVEPVVVHCERHRTTFRIS